MKTFIAILTMLFITALSGTVQSQFIFNGNNTVLKIPTNNVGLGTNSPGAKLSVVNDKDQTVLELKGYLNQTQPYFRILNSSGTVLAGLYVKTDWWSLGSSLDSTLALLVLKFNKNWIRINGTLHLTKLIVTTCNISGVVTGNALVRDTAHFPTLAAGNRNKFIRKKIIGVAAGDVFVISKIMASTTAIPDTSSIGYYCTTDSLIISRNSAATSGLGVSFIRFK